MGEHGIIGATVEVIFNREHWPISSAVYTYEGHDDEGVWVRKADGVQRYILNVDVHDIRPAPGDAVSDEEPPI